MAVTKLRFWQIAAPALTFVSLIAGLTAMTVWAAPAPEEAKEPARLHKLEIAAPGRVAFSEDGKALIHAVNRSVRTWEVATGKEQAAWEKKDFFVKALAPDGTSVAMLKGRDVLTIFEADTGKERCTLAGETDLYGKSNQCTYSPDGKLFVADYFGAGGYTLRFWDTAKGKEQDPIKGLKQGVTRSLAVSRDGRYLAIGCDGTDILLYDLATREQLRKFGEERAQHPDDRRGLSSPSRIVAITAVAFSPDGETLAAGDNDGTVTLFETATGKMKQRLGDGAKSLKDFTVPCVGQLVFSPDGSALLALDSYLAGQGDRKLHLWDVAAGKERPPLKLEGAAHFAALAPDGKRLAVAVTGENKSAFVEVWQVPSLVKAKR
jgi:WD40 repeat protein